MAPSAPDRWDPTGTLGLRKTRCEPHTDLEAVLFSSERIVASERQRQP
jgi:hypothetical protein